MENKEFATFLVPAWHELPGWKEAPQIFCENMQLLVGSQNLLEKHGFFQNIFCNCVDVDMQKNMADQKMTDMHF